MSREKDHDDLARKASDFSKKELSEEKCKKLLSQISEALGAKISKAIILGLGVKGGASVIMAPVLGDFSSIELVRMHEVAYGLLLGLSDVAAEHDVPYIATA
jgi:hypothetical protein